MTEGPISVSIASRPPVEGSRARVARLSAKRTDAGDRAVASFVDEQVKRAFEPAAPPELGCTLEFDAAGAILTCRVSLGSRARWYGAGLVAGPLLRNGRDILFFNADRWPYDGDTPGLYQCHPYLLAVLEGGKSVGILADCAVRGTAAIADRDVKLGFDAPGFDVYVISGDTPEEVQRALGGLLPRLPLPPRFALGYHQCRWSYDSEEEVMSLAREFRARRLPCDAIWLDIGHMRDFLTMTWDPHRFPTPAAMIERLHALGLRLVTIHDPGVVPSSSHELFVSGKEAADFVVSPSGDLMTGRVWPGECCFPDFRTARTRAWWAEHVARWVAIGVDGIWNDMNEPSVFDGPRTLVGVEALEGDFQNTYGFHMARATYEGLRLARHDKRPFVLSRANTIAGACYAAAWSGDNKATWDDLRWSITMTLSAGLCGQPFSGSDVGGFDGNPDPELFVRWFQVGAFLPFFRGHSDKYSQRKEPWAFGEEVEALVKAALDLRMQFLPVLYALFREAERTGLPVVRPLFFADPADPRLWAVEDAVLLGADIVVAPVVQPGERSRAVTLPRGAWYSFPEGRLVGSTDLTVPAPLDVVPIFVRAGHVLPLSIGGVNTDEAAAADAVIHVFLDERGRASGKLYEDGGDGFAYREGGGREVTIEASLVGDRLRIEARASGSYSPPRRAVRVHVYEGARGLRGTFDVDAEALSLSVELDTREPRHA